jgi:hypothetical protein
MKIGSMRETFLTDAKDIFLFDCQIADLELGRRYTYQNVLTSFIRFTGDILVRELTADHVKMYIANLSDGPNEGEDHHRVVMIHYAVIGTWVYWLCAQDSLQARASSTEGPRLTELFPLLALTRISTYCC